MPDTPEQYPRNYILDGQQRLTALYAVLNYPPERLDDRFKVVYDLQNRKFIEAKDELEPTHLPLNVLHETSQYTDFIVSLSEGQDNANLLR